MMDQTEIIFDDLPMDKAEFCQLERCQFILEQGYKVQKDLISDRLKAMMPFALEEFEYGRIKYYRKVAK